MVLHDTLLRVLDLIPEEGITLYSLVRETGADHRTLKKYLELISKIQNEEKITTVTSGFRVIIKKQGR